jgi:voltage-gated potassium channel
MSSIGDDGGGPSGPAPSRRALVAGVVRAVVSTTVLVLAYFLLPLDRLDAANPGLLLVLVVVGMMGIIAFQVWRILQSSEPTIRAGEALATTVPLLLLAFATAYFLLSQDGARSFSEPLDRLDALYFTVTVFSTVGFGDITPVSPTARTAVTVQMIINILMIGLGVRVIVGAAREGRRRLGEASLP